MGFAPQRSLGDSGKAKYLPALSSCLGVVWIWLPFHQRVYSGPASGNRLEMAAAGGWCSWEGIRHRSPAANPAGSWQGYRVGMQGCCLPFAWDGGLFRYGAAQQAACFC